MVFQGGLSPYPGFLVLALLFACVSVRLFICQDGYGKITDLIPVRLDEMFGA